MAGCLATPPALIMLFGTFCSCFPHHRKELSPLPFLLTAQKLVLALKLKQGLLCNGEPVHLASSAASQHSQYKPFPSAAEHLPGMHPHCGKSCPYPTQHVPQPTPSPPQATSHPTFQSLPLFLLPMPWEKCSATRAALRHGSRSTCTAMCERFGEDGDVSLIIRESAAVSYHECKEARPATSQRFTRSTAINPKCHPQNFLQRLRQV